MSHIRWKGWRTPHQGERGFAPRTRVSRGWKALAAHFPGPCLWIVLLGWVLLSACGGQATSNPEEVPSTPVATRTAVFTPTPMFTSTPPPPPTATPVVWSARPVTQVDQLGIRYQIGHPEIFSLRWLPGEDRVLMVDASGIFVLDAVTLDTLFQFPLENPSRVRISPSSAYLLAYEQKAFQVFSLETLEQVARFEASFTIPSAAFLNDERVVVTGVSISISPQGAVGGSQVHIVHYDVQTGRVLFSTKVPFSGGLAIPSFPRDTSERIFVRGNGSLAWLDARTGNVLARVTLPYETVNLAVSLRDAAVIVAPDNPNQLHLVEMRARKIVHTWTLDEPIRKIGFTSDGSRVYAQTDMQRIYWDRATFEEVTYTGEREGVRSRPNEDGRVVEWEEPFLRVLDAQGNPIVVRDDYYVLNGPVAFHPDGSRIAVLTSPDAGGVWLTLWDRFTMEEVARVPILPVPYGFQSTRMVYTEQAIFLVDSQYAEVLVFDPNTGERKEPLKVVKDPEKEFLHTLAASEDGTHLLVGSNWQLYQVTYPEGKVTRIEEAPWLYGVALDWEGDIAAAADFTEILLLFSPQSVMEDNYSLYAVETGARLPALSPDGQTWAFYQAEGHKVILKSFPENMESVPKDRFGGTNLQARKHPTRATFSLPESCEEVSRLAFSPDGRWLVALCLGGSLSLWDVATETALPLDFVNQPVKGFAFSSDGTLLAITSTEGTLTFWGAP